MTHAVTSRLANVAWRLDGTLLGSGWLAALARRIVYRAPQLNAPQSSPLNAARGFKAIRVIPKLEIN